MPEAVVGATTSDILHQQKTAEGSLTFEYHTHDTIANTIGHILAIPTIHTMLWTWGSAFKNPSKELADQLFDRYKDVPWKGDVLVRVGHASIIGDMQRAMARNESVRGRPWRLKDIPGRVMETVGKLGIAFFTFFATAGAKFTRSDFYNPYANSATIYHPKLAIGMHELGHAEFYNQRDNVSRVGLLIMDWLGLNVGKDIVLPVPFFRSFTEYKASEIAMKRFKTDEERREGLKVLEAAWATYLFGDVLSLSFLPKPITDSIGAVLSYPASVAGHLMNRLYPKKDQRFGFVFEGKKTDKHIAYEKAQVLPKSKKDKQPELSAHQVLVATAKAPKSRELPVEGKGGRQFTEEPLKNGKRPLHSNTSRITF
ncbi:hypothetical protein HZB58_03620 [Candidatus Gottesmanbacteria bacterium]|nr:hypothetical protein [Candidatus Gottesmanbacteria bacterium]